MDGGRGLIDCLEFIGKFFHINDGVSMGYLTDLFELTVKSHLSSSDQIIDSAGQTLACPLSDQQDKLPLPQ